MLEWQPDLRELAATGNRNRQEDRLVAAAVDIGTLITRSPEIRGGRPRIAGTGITVTRIASWHRVGKSPEDIVHGYGHLSLAQVYAALAYYHANREEIDQDMGDEEAASAELERLYGQASRP
jgi:uncharacterized protein (DUF433 family)